MSGLQALVRRLFPGYLLVALLAVTTVLASQDVAEAKDFNPSGSACLDDAATADPDPFNLGSANECDGANTPGANTDLTTTFGIAAPNANFAAGVAFAPAQWGIARDAEVPDGALVGKLTSQAVLGLLNNGCQTPLVVNFDFVDAVTSQSATTTFETQFADDDGDGIPNGGELWPDYLSRLLIDQNGAPLQARSRLYGQTSVASINVSLNFVIFEPGVNIRGTRMDAALGFPSVTILQSIGDPLVVPAPQPITDFCSPLKTQTTLFGVAKDNPKTSASDGGAAYRTNPSAAGGYNFTAFSLSQRDADDDGMENGLDTCPLDVAPAGYDVRGDLVQAGLDDDGDGLPNNCDPTVAVNTNFNDHDGDGYANRGDNCPLVANGTDAASTENQTDSDTDGIGNPCDTNPSTADGHNHLVCLVFEIDIGAGGTPAFNPQSLSPCDPNAAPYTPPGQPTPTLAPGATPRPVVGTNGLPGPSSGVGSLSPVAAGIPLWAAVLTAAGGLGVLASLSTLASRTIRRRK